MHQTSELAQHSSETKTCPQCKKQMPVASEYITWCEYCDYNVNPAIPEESTPITRLYERLGERLGTAISTIYTWFDLLYPEKATNGEREDGVSLLEVPAYYFMKAISFIPYSLIYLLTFFLYRNKQVAEFKAELFEAEVTGTHTAMRTLEKLHYGDLFAYISRKVALNKEKLNLFTELRSRVANLPERERKRLKRKTELEKTRIDTTHPTTRLRMNLLKAKTVHPKIKLTSLEVSALQKELEKLEEPIQEKIIDEIKYELYQW
ncbi:hypothetical protein SAMN05877753_101517 [Bacillus oleivorans]|uniref:Uncharacterized protein n=1 Tax=Bacillus oleivorans TaxID=1448271 RepID=A0A285CI56_9BACI|nr:hypothetical protein [Bacillus oleivorans]SNX67200.1 hypothetical protein SAMN05877753_101517 [Bacillus oleivorans]